MMCCRFRLDRSRGRAVKVNHLLSIPLAGLRMSDVAAFVEKVKLCMTSIAPGEIKDHGLLYEWLYEKFKNWSHIAAEIRKI